MTVKPEGKATPSEYEERAIREIHAWKNPELTWFDSALRVINVPLDAAADAAFKIPGIDWVIEKTLVGILGLLNDAAQWTVQVDGIYGAFDGKVKRREDILSLDLEEVDRAIGFLAAKYKGITFTEGAALGTVGLPGIPPDVIAVLGLNLRAIGEYATYTGFDVSHQQERLFVLNVLGMASSPTAAAKQVALAQLVKIAKDVAAKRTWKQLETHLFVQIVQAISKALSIRLTKAKLAQIVPGVGAAIGGGFNAYFTAKVCDSAYYLYRERFLAAKYGPEVIEETVKPASSDDFAGGYEET